MYATSAQELDRKLETFRWALRLRSGSVLRVKRQRWLEGRARRATVYFKLPAASLRGLPALGN